MEKKTIELMLKGAQMINWIYRNFLCNVLSHEAKMKVANFFYKLPFFHDYLENQYDFYPNVTEEQRLPAEEQKKIYEEYVKKNGWEKNDLEKIFFDAPHNLVCKHLRYLRVYDQYFSRFKEKDTLTIVEVGIFGGGLYSFGSSTLGKMCE